MIKQVKFVSIPVKDHNAALKFYTEKLGFSILTDQPMGPGQRWIELAIGSAPTNVVLFTPEEHASRIGTFQNISFATDNVQKSYDEMVARGVEFKGPPKKESWGTFAIFQDVDGNSFVLSSSR